MARLIVALFALIASAAAFAPSTTPTALRTSVVSYGYVPDGLTEAQWKAKQTKESKAKADNKVKVRTTWGPGRTGQEKSLTEFQKKRDAKYPNTPGAGHMWAKSKKYSFLDSREGGDAREKQKRDEARAGIFGARK